MTPRVCPTGLVCLSGAAARERLRLHQAEKEESHLPGEAGGFRGFLDGVAAGWVACKAGLRRARLPFGFGPLSCMHSAWQKKGDTCCPEHKPRVVPGFQFKVAPDEKRRRFCLFARTTRWFVRMTHGTQFVTRRHASAQSLNANTNRVAARGRAAFAPRKSLLLAERAAMLDTRAARGDNAEAVVKGQLPSCGEPHPKERFAQFGECRRGVRR